MKTKEQANNIKRSDSGRTNANSHNEWSETGISKTKGSSQGGMSVGDDSSRDGGRSARSGNSDKDLNDNDKEQDKEDANQDSGDQILPKMNEIFNDIET